jgi:hypothetical protein
VNVCEQAVIVIDGKVVLEVDGTTNIGPWTTNVPKSGIAYVSVFSENNNAMTSVTSLSPHISYLQDGVHSTDSR